MSDREELAALRRLAELEGKAGGAPAKSGGYFSDRMGELGDILGGAVKGASQIGATIMAPVDIAKDALNGKGLSLESNRQRRKDVSEALTGFGVDLDSNAARAGQIGTEIAGTAGMGGLLANGLRAVPAIASRAAPVISAIESGGMTAGGVTGLKSVAPRVIGGGVTGGASAGLVNPESAPGGAGIGGVLPPVLMAGGAAGRAIGAGVRNLRTPAEVVTANKLAQALEMSPEELRAALSQQGPQMIPGYQQTVPQILQNPTASQLQRTLKTAGTNAIGDAERVQQAGYRNALERVAPIDISLQDAANRTGGAIEGFAKPAREQATTNVRAAFDAVDPFNETALHLPVDKMQGAVDKYLGPGTFGTGSRARDAVRVAQEVGTEALPAVKATKAGPDETLLAAVRKAGINPNSISSKQFAGEVRDLRQSAGMGGITNSKSGKPLERVAESMYEQGFIPDGDPATLLNALREGGGQVRAGAGESGMRAQLERSMGDAPAAGAIAKPVPFATVQNLRSSIGEAAEAASAKGANKEAAALRQMVAEIDSRVNRAAGGSAAEGEFFPRDVADQYRKALDLHAQKMQQFETGPQMGMFRKGGDGQASIQGAEIPGKFYSGRRSQVEDVQSFKRLIGDKQDLAQEMKRYALTEGASTSNQAGDLTSKFTKWMESRTGANRELFNPQEMATINEVGKAVERSLAAENLGRASGSNTAQNLASLQSLGMLDNKLVDAVANRTPIIGRFLGAGLDGLRQSATKAQNNRLAALMANPEQLAAALQSPAAGSPNALARLAMEQALPLTYRAAPLLSAQ